MMTIAGSIRKIVLLFAFRTKMSRVLLGVVMVALIFALCSPIVAQSSAERLRDGNRARDGGRLSEAETIYRSLLGDPAVDESARAALAQVLSWQGKFDGAIEQYQELQRRYPQRSYDANIGLARCYAWSGRFRQAVEVCEKGLAADPDNPDLLLLLGQVESWAGHTKKSIAAFDRLLAKDPGNRMALLGRARALSWSGNFAKAEQQFQAILAENPGDVEARVGLVHNLIWMGRQKEASEVFDKIGQNDRDRRDVQLAKVALERSLGKRAEYRKDLDTLRTQYPGDPDVGIFTRLEVNEFGPYLRTRGSYVSDSEDLQIRSYIVEGAFTLTPSNYLFFEGLRSDLSYPANEDVSVSSATIGLDSAVARGVTLRFWGGSRHAEDADNEIVGGTRILLRARSNTRLSAGYEESYADYTPQAVRNNVRLKTADLSFYVAATPRFSITGDAALQRFKSDLFSQRRDLFDVSLRWALPAYSPLRTDVGLRGKYFKFDDADLDTGYFNPRDFRQILAFVTLTRTHRERTRFMLDLAYGAKRVADRGWENSGTAGLVLSIPLAEKIDLTARAGYERISITTGNYSSRSASLGLLFRLK